MIKKIVPICVYKINFPHKSVTYITDDFLRKFASHICKYIRADHMLLYTHTHTLS